MTTDLEPRLDPSLLPLSSARKSRLAPGLERMSDWPWWLIVAILLGLIIVLQILTNQKMTVIFGAVAAGLVVTIRTTIVAYSLAVVIGLFVGLARVSSSKVILNLSSWLVVVSGRCASALRTGYSVTLWTFADRSALKWSTKYCARATC